MQHVRQRLRMHQPVLNRHFQHADQLRMPFLRPLECMLDLMVQFLSQTPVVAVDFFARRPISRGIRRQSPIHRVDAKRKQLIERTVGGAQSKRA